MGMNDLWGERENYSLANNYWEEGWGVGQSIGVKTKQMIPGKKKEENNECTRLISF